MLSRTMAFSQWLWIVVVGLASAFSPPARSGVSSTACYAQCVLFTGYEDMRVLDHPGLALAAASGERWCAAVLDEEKKEPSTSRQVLRRRALRFAAQEVDGELRSRYGGGLGLATDVTKVLSEFDTVYVVDALGVCQDLLKNPKVKHWLPPGLCGLEPEDASFRYDECQDIRIGSDDSGHSPPSSSNFFEMKEAFSSSRYYGEKEEDSSEWSWCEEPYAWEASKVCGCVSALKVLEDYGRLGRAELSRSYLGDVKSESLYAAAQQWVVGEQREGKVAERLAVRECAERLFAPSLAVGGVSKRQVAAFARKEGANFPVNKIRDVSRTDSGALLDVAEWRDWHDRLHLRKKEDEQTHWWRWSSGGYLIRYKLWGETTAKAEEALLLVHGFGASADQWNRLVDAMQEKGHEGPIFAVDVVGFGFSAKPGLSYTQHLWEAMLLEFVEEVVLATAKTVVLAGNSIGGGLAAGVAANLGKTKCAGLVLCNSAGVILTPEEDALLLASGITVKEKTLNVLSLSTNPSLKPFSTPFGGQLLLDGFGQGVIEVLAPQIPKLLKRYYPTNPDNADDTLAKAIDRDARDPGCANVIGSGAKLPPQRSLNEVLRDFDGPVLVAQGEFDYVSGPERTRLRAKQLEALPKVTVDILNSGHCPHDESPHLVATSLLSWLSCPNKKQQ